ncbi:MAG: flagellar filament capping protein FliD [Burkholderiaceae bacterium]|nr:flagellar filament capping protein FliD [Burkholderiaceae bacterium]
MATNPVNSSSSAASTAADIQAANKAAAQRLLTSLNAGSGVDVASLAQNLVDAERIPKENAINAKISRNEARISGLSAVMFMMEEFKTKLSELKDKSSYNALTASNSSPSALNVTTTNAAVAGSYNINITSLAKPQRSVSATGFASATATLPAGGNADLLLSSPNRNGVSTGTPASSQVPTFMTSIAGVSFGTQPSVTDFKEFSLTVDGKVLNLRPAPASTDLNALAADLQKQLRALDGTNELSVSVSGTTLQFQSSNITRTLSNVQLSNSTTIRLDTGASVGTPAVAGNSISGIRFGTTPQVTDFRSFTVKIGDRVRTVIPAPEAPTVSALAADLQRRLRILEGNDDVVVSADGGTLNISSRSGKPITQAALTKQNYDRSPDGIVAAINDANAGVKAEVVNDGTPGTPFKIMVTGASGASETFTLESATTGLLTFDTRPENVASDAQLSVNGVNYTRKSNTLSDVISGATLELRSTTSSAASVVFTQDTSAIKEKFRALVTAYNDVDSIIKETTDPKSTLDTYGKTLVGDSTTRLVRQQIRSLFLGQSSTPGTAITSMADLGFKTDQKGVLSLDENKLDAALKSNYPDIVRAMTGNQSNISSVSTQPAGVIGDTVRRLTRLLDNNGPLRTKTVGAESENTRHTADLEKLKDRMESLLIRYNRQFAAMESLVGSVNAQKSSLKSTFEGMMAAYTNG